MIEPRHRDDPPAGPVSSSDDGANGVTARVASAVVLALVALAVAYVGGAVFLALCAVAAGGILGEWVWLVRRRADARILTPGLLALAAAAAFIGLGRLDAAAAAIAVGAMAGTNQAWLDSLWQYIRAQSIESRYYEDTIKMLTMIVLSGNWWAP